MSLKRNEEVACPVCGKKKIITIWSVLSSTDKEGTSLLRSGELNMFHCAPCRYRSLIDEPVLYDDAERQFCIQYVSRDALRSAAFYANITRNGDLVMDPISTKAVERGGLAYLLRPYFVFTLPEVSHCIFFRRNCAEHGLDPAGPFTHVEPPAHFRSLNPLLEGSSPPRISEQLQAAKSHLSERQMINFFHAADSEYGVRSVQYLCEHLADGMTLDDIFSMYEPEPSDPSEPIGLLSRLVAELKVEPLAEHVYAITFGIGGADSGDGAEWLVVFDETGAIRKLARADEWIA